MVYYLCNMGRDSVSNGSVLMLTAEYNSPLGPITIACSGDKLVGLWFMGQRHYGSTLAATFENAERGDVSVENRVLEDTRRWLDIYFAGHNPDFLPKYEMIGSGFQIKVWRELTNIPYGTTTTYKAIADKLNTAPRAIGAAVGRNPLTIMIPCHRVISTSGSLAGYAGGLERKAYLLNVEKIGRK